jgi:hypothetical protein
MNMHTVHKFLFLAAVLLLAGGLAESTDKSGSASRTWPLVNVPNLSSSFGEHRNGHLHAGIDIRTGGQDGVACPAVGDGYIYRIRASAYGYGKALYLRLKNGETAVYAHLSEFSPPIEDWVYQEQVRQGNYQVNLFPDSGQFPVREGDIIAYSGSTGAGAPHLHFEIRDKLEKPMNPLKTGWSLPDDIHPVIDQVVWIPLGENGRINGGAFPHEVTADKLGEGRFICRDTVSLAGQVGIAARIYDRHNGRSGRLAPYRVQLFIDGERRAQLDMDSFSFKQGVQVDLIYEMERVLSRREYFFTLFERQGETVWDRWFVNAGVIDPSLDRSTASTIHANQRGEETAAGPAGPTFHTAEIHAVDCFGNSSVLSVIFSSGEAESEQRTSAVGDSTNNPLQGLPAIYLFDDLISVRTDLLDDEGLSRLSAAYGDLHEDGWRDIRHGHKMQFTATSAAFDTCLIVLPPSPAAGTHPLYLIPVQGDTIEQLHITELDAVVGVPGRALYGHGFISLAQWDAGNKQGNTQKELRLQSKIIQIGPLSLAMRSFLELSFLAGEPWSEKEGIYQLNEKKGKWALRPTLTTDTTISAHIRRPGIYAVLSDRTPPRIGTPQLTKHRMYADGRTFPEIVISLVDEGAGLDDGNTEILLDGERQIARWDGFSKKVFVLLRKQNIIGTHGLTVIALDRAGNESQLQSSLTITRDYFSDTDKRNIENVE